LFFSITQYPYFWVSGKQGAVHKAPQVAFKPDWSKHAKAAPFKRNDQMLDCS
jgi:hypothetical protein